MRRFPEGKTTWCYKYNLQPTADKQSQHLGYVLATTSVLQAENRWFVVDLANTKTEDFLLSQEMYSKGQIILIQAEAQGHNSSTNWDCCEEQRLLNVSLHLSSDFTRNSVTVI